MKEIQGQKFYDRKDLAKLLDVTIATIANKQRKGELKAIYIGRSLYTSEENLRKFLNGETTKPITEVR